MMRRPLALIAAAVATVSLAACGGGSSAVTVTGAATSDPVAADTASSSAGGGSSTSAPDFLQDVAVGDCLDQPAGEWKSGDCAKGHEFEVSAIVPSKWDRHDAEARSAVRVWTCNDVAAAYLGGPIRATFFQAIPLPAAADPQSADRIICLTHQTAPENKLPETFGPMRGQLSDPEKLAARRLCLLDETSKPGESQAVHCSGEHSAEGVTNLSLGTMSDPYPSPSDLTDRMLKACTPKVRDYLGGVDRKDLVVGAIGPSEAKWKAGTRYVTCFVNIKGTRLTKSVKDIKNKSLKAYR